MIAAVLHPLLLQAGSPPPTAPPAPTDPGEFVREVARNWSGSGTFNVSGGLLVFAGVILLLLALWMWRRYRSDSTPSRPMAVFRRVAAKVSLSLGEQVLLTRIARQQNLPTPLTLLLSSGTLDHHGRSFAESLPAAQQRAALAKIARVGRKVFGQ